MFFFYFLAISSMGAIFKNPATSSFGEYRGGRFHYGVDFSTYKLSGIPLISPFNGKIIRLTVQNQGYGKAIYIRDNTDIIYVFAHLQKFSKELDSLVYLTLLTEQKNDIDLWIDIPLKKSDTIGFSGNTGTKIPHLHFETRLNMDICVNPFYFINFNIDTIPPFIESLLFIPVSRGLVQGSYFPYYLKAQKKVNEVFIIGDFFLWVKAYDYFSDKDNKMAIYSLKIFLNDSLVAFYRMDTLRFSEKALSDYLYFKDAAYFSESWIHPLFIEEKNMNFKGTSFLSCLKEKTLKVIAEDFHQNRDSIIVNIKKGVQGRFFPRMPASSDKIKIKYRTFLDGIAGRVQGKAGEKIQVKAVFGDKEQNVPFLDYGFIKEFKVLPPPGYTGSIIVFFETERKTIKHEFYCINIEPEKESEGKYKDIKILLKKNTAIKFPFYVFISIKEDTIKILPEYIFFDAPLLILKSLKDKECWIKIEKDGIIPMEKHGDTLKIKFGGTYTTGIDTIAPVVKGDSLLFFSSDKFFNPEWILQDNLTGIECNSIKFTINQRFEPVSYNPYTGKLQFFKPLKMKKGNYRFTIQAKDKLGNSKIFKGIIKEK